MRRSEQGRISIIAVSAVTFGLGLGASVFLNIIQAQNMSDMQAQLKGQIADLSYQLKQDQSHLTSPSPTPAITPTPAPAQPSKVLTLSELGVSLTAYEPLLDLTYAYQPTNGVPTVGFSSQSLETKYPKCVPSFLGQLSRRPVGARPASNEVFIKTLGGNSFYYIRPVVECATDVNGKNLRAAMVSALSSTILPTLN